MSTNQLRAVGAGLFFVVVFLSGFWMSRSGKPYNGLVLNVHKLIALAAVVILVMTLYRTNRVAPLGAPELLAGVMTGLFAVGLFATGALSSIDRSMPAVVATLHHIMPYLAVLSTAATIYLLSGRS